MKTPAQIKALARGIRENPAVSDRELRRKFESCVTQVKAKSPKVGAYGVCTASLYRAHGKARVSAALATVRRKSAKKAAATRARKARHNPAAVERRGEMWGVVGVEHPVFKTRKGAESFAFLQSATAKPSKRPASWARTNPSDPLLGMNTVIVDTPHAEQETVAKAIKGLGLLTTVKTVKMSYGVRDDIRVMFATAAQAKRQKGVIWNRLKKAGLKEDGYGWSVAIGWPGTREGGWKPLYETLHVAGLAEVTKPRKAPATRKPRKTPVKRTKKVQERVVVKYDRKIKMYVVLGVKTGMNYSQYKQKKLAEATAKDINSWANKRVTSWGHTKKRSPKKARKPARKARGNPNIQLHGTTVIHPYTRHLRGQEEIVALQQDIAEYLNDHDVLPSGKKTFKFLPNSLIVHGTDDIVGHYRYVWNHNEPHNKYSRAYLALKALADKHGFRMTPEHGGQVIEFY